MGRAGESGVASINSNQMSIKCRSIFGWGANRPYAPLCCPAVTGEVCAGDMEDGCEGQIYIHMLAHMHPYGEVSTLAGPIGCDASRWSC
jgi:hypothetical protein